MKAKNLNNKNRYESKSNNQNLSNKISITNELTKLNKLHSDGVLNKKQFLENGTLEILVLQIDLIQLNRLSVFLITSNLQIHLI